MTLPKYTSVGCYPLFYVHKGHEAYCQKCAEENGLSELDAHVHWEGELACDNCSEEIEAAYPDA